MAKKNMNTLSMKVSASEGLTEEVNIANIKEVLKYVSLMVYEDEEYISILFNNGEKIYKKRQKEFSK